MQREAAKRGLPLLIADWSTKAKPLPLEGHVSSAVEDRFDVSVFVLDSDVVQELPNRKFLSLGYVNHSDGPLSPGWFLVCGCPSRWAVSDKKRKKAKAKPLSYGTVLHQGPTDALQNYEAQWHVLLELYSEGNVDSLTHEKVDMPATDGRVDIRGMSGGCIWQAINRADNASNWSPERARIVGVQTRIYSESGIIKGTRWSIVRRILAEQFPELSPSFHLHGF